MRMKTFHVCVCSLIHSFRMQYVANKISSSLSTCQLFASTFHPQTDDSLSFFFFKFFSLVLSYMGCLYILQINSLSIGLFAIIFSHAEGCLFTFLMVSFIVRKLLSLIRSRLVIFVFISITLGHGS